MKVKIEGLAELDGTLGRLIAESSSATAKNALRRALTKAGQPVADRAKQLVAVDSGGLQRSIKVSGRLANPVGKPEFAEAMRAGLGRAAAVAAMRDARRGSDRKTTIEVYIGPGQQPHAHLIEFGWSHGPARPYLRPAWEETRDQVLADIKVQVEAEMDRAIQRARRKAARRAERGEG